MSKEKLREIYLDLWHAYVSEVDITKRGYYGSLYCAVKEVFIALYPDSEE